MRCPQPNLVVALRRKILCILFRLADWVAGAADRERARDEKRQVRLDKRKAEAEGRMHKFRDEQYMEQKEAVTTNLDDALTQVRL